MTETLRRVPSSVGNPVAVDVIVDKILNEQSDGATVLSSGSNYGGSGIVVALPDHGIPVNPRVVQALSDLGMTVEDLVRGWIVSQAEHVVGAQTLRQRAYGVWADHSTDTIYLDLVEIYPDDEEEAAVAAGFRRNQIAVWHNGRREEIPTHGTGVTNAELSKLIDGDPWSPSAAQLADLEELPPVNPFPGEEKYGNIWSEYN